MDFLYKTFYHNTVVEWAIAASIIIGTFILAKALYWFFNRVVKKITEKSKSKLDDLLLDKTEEPVVFAVAIYVYGLPLVPYISPKTKQLIYGLNAYIIF